MKELDAISLFVSSMGWVVLDDLWDNWTEASEGYEATFSRGERKLWMCVSDECVLIVWANNNMIFERSLVDPGCFEELKGALCAI
jgi:hypothetical protein